MNPLILLSLLGGMAVASPPSPTVTTPPSQPPAVTSTPVQATYTAAAPPPYVEGKANRIDYTDPSAFAHLAKRWAETDRQVVIAHFGDSHVQKGYITEAARLALEAQRGFGGRGMVFPYAVAKTYSQNDLTSTFTGTWRTGNSIQQPPRLPVGIAGFAAQTSDPDATVTLDFMRPLDPGAKRVRVFFAVQGRKYRLRLGPDENSQTRQVSFSSDEATFEPDTLANTVTLAIHAEQADPGSFTLLGISIENRPAAGVLYHNLGVGGAVYGALLQQTYFENEMKIVKPDLVILDWGTNDLIYTKAPAGDFEQVVADTIARVRRAAPNADILLTSTQDMTFRGRDIDGAALAMSLRRIALAQGCLYWDWYRVSGGSASAAKWRADMLLGSDGVHLTGRGYRLKGRPTGGRSDRHARRAGTTCQRLRRSLLRPEAGHSVRV